MGPSALTLGIVGVCGSGKSTLAAGLKAHGYNPRHIAQEHSFTPDMWQRISNPDLLIFLEVSYPETMRRKNIKWLEREYQEQIARTKHAYAHANLVIQTDQLSPQEILHRVLDYIEALK